MRAMEVSRRIDRVRALDAYHRLADLAAYPSYTEAVRHVHVRTHDGRRSISAWEVDFNQGILRWTEEELFDPEGRRIRFRQLEGDLEAFEGEWLVEEEGDGTRVLFRARFDLGVPTLSDMLDPVAEQALRDNVDLILTGLARSDRSTAPAA